MTAETSPPAPRARRTRCFTPNILLVRRRRLPVRIALAAFALVALHVASPPVVARELSERELTCLALNVYHEARNQPIEGQLAVAHVTLNRVAAASQGICQVVYRQGAFSWTSDPRKKGPPRDEQAWAVARTVARWALIDRESDPVGGSTFFHSVTVSPDWAPAMVRVRQIGDHVFYRDGESDRVTQELSEAR